MPDTKATYLAALAVAWETCPAALRSSCRQAPGSWCPCRHAAREATAEQITDPKGHDA